MKFLKKLKEVIEKNIDNVFIEGELEEKSNLQKCILQILIRRLPLTKPFEFAIAG